MPVTTPYIPLGNDFYKTLYVINYRSSADLALERPR